MTTLYERLRKETHDTKYRNKSFELEDYHDEHHYTSNSIESTEGESYGKFDSIKSVSELALSTTVLAWYFIREDDYKDRPTLISIRLKIGDETGRHHLREREAKVFFPLLDLMREYLNEDHTVDEMVEMIERGEVMHLDLISKERLCAFLLTTGTLLDWEDKNE